MKKIITFLFFTSAMCISAFAQTQIAAFEKAIEKAKEIKLLASTRADVRRILVDYENDDPEDDDSQFQSFSTKDVEIQVKYSRGDCSRFLEFWNVSEGIVAKISVKPKEKIKLKDYKFDFSKFKKEIEDEESLETYNYHNEDVGIIYVIDEGEIEEIVFHPAKNKIGFLCDNEYTSEFLSGAERLIDLALREGCELINIPANVSNITLSRSEIIISDIAAKNKKYVNSSAKISVSTEAIDAENDVLTYNYDVSGGKIIGQGAQVVWDLTGVKPGTYTITAGVDDGCGICGQTQTQTVVVK